MSETPNNKPAGEKKELSMETRLLLAFASPVCAFFEWVAFLPALLTFAPPY